MSDTRTKPVDGFAEVDFNSEPFLTDFKKVYEEEYGQFGGEPFGCLMGDYYFDHTPPDVELLGEMSKISAASLVYSRFES